MNFLIFMICFAVLILLGMPISISMIVCSFAYVYILDLSPAMLSMNMFAGLNSFVLLAVPLFLLTAEAMNQSTVSKRIFDFCHAMVGYIPGGMGHVNVVTSIIFAGMSGSAVADVGGIGHLSYQAMVDKGYDKEFSASVTMASSLIGPIIPPSIPMVVYSMVADVSLGKLFFGGIGPGLIMGLAMMVYIYIISIKRGYPSEPMIPLGQYFRDILVSFWRSILPLLTPLILLGTIYNGVVTVTEAAAIAVAYALLLGMVIYRAIGFRGFLQVIAKVFTSLGAVLLVIIAGKAFGFVLTNEHIQSKVYDLMIMVANGNKIVIILLINLLFLFLGCLSDPLVNIMLFAPMVLPLAEYAQMDPVHFGVILILNAMVGNLTPPVGSVLMAVCSLEKLNYEKAVKALVPFIVMLLGIIVVMLFIPGIVTWIPNFVFGE